MSILLDALKRSEQQRRLGEVPDIHSPLGAEPGSRGNRNRRLTWILLGIVVVILAWLAWQGIEPGDPPATNGADSAQAPAAGAGETLSGDTEGSAGGIPAGDDAEKPRMVARTPVETLPQSPEMRGTTARNHGTPAEQGAPRKARVNESFTQFEAPAQADVEPVAPEQARTSDSPAQALADGAGEAGAESTAAPRTTASPSKATEPISFWELPQGVRDSLPELRITVLVYADRAENRFILMAGRRLFEKDEFQPGIVLDEIRRDGAVFVYRNYRFLVKG